MELAALALQLDAVGLQRMQVLEALTAQSNKSVGRVHGACRWIRW